MSKDRAAVSRGDEHQKLSKLLYYMTYRSTKAKQAYKNRVVVQYEKIT
jgi:hypothetical protein